MPVGQKEEGSCGGIPMRAAAAITMGVVFFILFFEMVVEDGSQDRRMETVETGRQTGRRKRK